MMLQASEHVARGFSLLELLAVVTILGIIAAIIVPRVTVSSSTAKTKVRDHHKATINAAVERFYVDTNTWPANDLSDIGANANYFPDGIPTNPVDGIGLHAQRHDASRQLDLRSRPWLDDRTRRRAQGSASARAPSL